MPYSNPAQRAKQPTLLTRRPAFGAGILLGLALFSILWLFLRAPVQKDLRFFSVTASDILAYISSPTMPDSRFLETLSILSLETGQARALKPALRRFSYPHWAPDESSAIPGLGYGELLAEIRQR
jgi:hypothetical protein